VHYLAAEKAINLANQVFGFNGWSSSIQNVQIDFVDENSANGKISLGLSTIVRVTIRDGTFHEDIGYGHIENCKGKAAAFEKAKKEAATDALKRALRNFGNVLGNCLYDKEYLQKVQRIKIAPSRWDAENLHRHPDFAPVKRESIAEAAEAHQKMLEAKGGVGRQASVQSRESFGSVEFEDDFGGMEFDEADFRHADEAPSIDTPVRPPQQKQGVQRMQSMQQMQPTNVPSPAAVHNPQVPQKPSGPPKSIHSVEKPQQVQQPQTNGVNVAGVQQRGSSVPPVPPQNNAKGGSRSNPTSANSTSRQPNQQPYQPNPPQQPHPNLSTPAQHSDLDSDGLPIPRMPPPGIPEGFVTGRNADIVNLPPNSAATAANRPSSSSIAFNPHADSPSIRRTHGVNPGKSAPVMRSAIPNTAAANAPATNGVASARNPGTVPPQTGGAASGVSNGLNGATTPVRTNFVNPAADMNRRIGMPPTAAGVLNRSAYRPPQAAAPQAQTNMQAAANAGLKRPPLSDVSNLQAQTDGAGDAKKARMEQQDAEAGGGNAVAPA
jgi:DNA repair and recombination protein RAD52